MRISLLMNIKLIEGDTKVIISHIYLSAIQKGLEVISEGSRKISLFIIGSDLVRTEDDNNIKITNPEEATFYDQETSEKYQYIATYKISSV